MKLRKLLASILALCMVLSTMGTVAFAEDTEADVLEIATVEDFIAFAEASQDGNSFSGMTIKLTSDIDFEGANYLEIAEDGTVVTDYRIPKFSGTFDGDGHTIKNFNFVVNNCGKHSVMMFSQDNMGAYIKNLNIENVNVNIADISGETRVTALANRVNAGGFTDAAIKNVHIKNFKIVSNNTTSGDLRIGGLAYFVQGSQLIAKDCSIDGFEVDVNAALLFGGVASVVKSACDFINVDVKNAVFNIDNLGSSGVIGGFVGQTQDKGTGTTFTDCDVEVEMTLDSAESLIGGFVGSIGSVSQFYNCTTEGSITVENGEGVPASIGGFSGDLGWNGMFQPDVQHEFNNCVADVDITAVNANVGGFIGDSTVSGYPKRYMPTYFNDCEAKGDIKTTVGVAGGFVGTGDRGMFYDCSASGNVEGRIAGGFWGEIYPKSEAESTGGWSYQDKVVTHTDVNSKSIVLKGNTVTGTATGTEYSADLIGYVKDIYLNDDDTKGYATPMILAYNSVSNYNRHPYTTKVYEVATKAELNDALIAAEDGDTILLIDDIDYGTDHLEITKGITLDLGSKTLTTRARNYGLALKNRNIVVKNGELNHAGTVAAIKVWNAKEISNLEIDVTGTSVNGIDGIVVQENAEGVEIIKNVKIHSTGEEGVVTGIKTHNCGNAQYPVIGLMDNVTIDAKQVGLNIYAPCGTATNCDIKGGVSGIEIWIKGEYSATLDLVDCEITGGAQAVYAHDEFNSNPSTVNNGLLELTVDEKTELTSESGADAITLTLARAENVAGVLKDVKDNATAKVNNTYYSTLQKAIDSIGSAEGDYVIKVIKDIEENITVTQYGNQKITIEGDETNRPVISGTVTVNGRSNPEENEALTLKNLAFNADAAINNAVVFIPSGNYRYAMNITVEDCDVVGKTDAAYNSVTLIRESTGGGKNFVVKNTTVTGIHSLMQAKNIMGLEVDGCKIIDCSEGINLNNTPAATIKNTTADVAGYAVRIGQSKDAGTPLDYDMLVTLENNTFTSSSTESSLIVARGGAQTADFNIKSGTYTNTAGMDVLSLIEGSDAAISGGFYSSNVGAYVVDGYALTRTGNGYLVVEDSEADDEGKDQADSISIEYKDITAAEAEGEKIYEVVVKANDDDMINELASVDISFAFATAPIEDGDMAITVLPATDFTISRYENTDRYMFNYNGTSAFEGTANAITVATITVEGYGSYSIATAEADTNIVNATTLYDNLVDSYTAAGATDDDTTTGGLVINEDTVADDGLVGEVENDVIAVPTRTLTIDITFPNAVVNNAISYQDMTVTIVGGTVNETIALGTDGEAYKFTRELPYNTAYTVTVSGAGYRTARYTVNLNDDKQLNFWNNVMDEAQVVEIGKDSSVAKVTFLAGDIVKDNNINIYDLSAVVSYFGTENLVEDYPEYAKYDLNRDGVIDSKDVAYVLVSWNN